MPKHPSGLPRTVVISEPHMFTPYMMVGGHQYAKIFAQHGWNVACISASFHVAHLWRKNSSLPGCQIDLWKSRGKKVESQLTNFCFAHWLPRRIRYVPALRRVASALFTPNPRMVLRSLNVAKADLLWLNGNEDWLYRYAIPHSKLIVRIIDNYAGFGADYNNFHPLLRETLEASDAVFTCSHAVRQLYSPWRKDISVVPNGVDLIHFSRSTPSEPNCVKSIPRPRITYVGFIGSWFDLDLLMTLAKRKPEWHFVVAGPWENELLSRAAYPPNIHVLGRVPYQDVPGLLAFSDVGLVPFKNSDLVNGVSPIKVYEYLAAGLPVVSLRWRELQMEELPVILAEGEGEFLEGIAIGLQKTTADKARMKEHVISCSWEHRLKTILNRVGISLDPKTAKV